MSQAPDEWPRQPTAMSRLTRVAFDAAAEIALRDFERRLSRGVDENQDTLRRTLRLNANTVFGRRYDFKRLINTAEPWAAFRDAVPLSQYLDYEAYVERIASGEPNVLTADPVHMLAGSSGTTGTPKRIPRTRRAQRHHMRLVVLAEQAVLNRAFPGVRGPELGINLMSCYAPPSPETTRVPVLAGPNSGMARFRRFMPLLWCAPEPVFNVAEPRAAMYLQALFALRYSAARFIQSPFAPQITSWFALIQDHQAELVRDLHDGTIADWLELSEGERAAVEQRLGPAPARAAEVARILAGGLEGVVPRLWPNIQYVWTVISGSFSMSLPRLRWHCGPNVHIHAGCHSSSEGILGIRLTADEGTDYALAIGSAFFEFIPLEESDAESPTTVSIGDLRQGGDYELVLTSSAGLYRYRLGDVIRITGGRGTTPTFEYLYRRGTLLNLVGEKTSELHTSEAVSSAIAQCTGSPDALRDYTVTGSMIDGIGQYTFFVELADSSDPTSWQDTSRAAELVDLALGTINPYYRTSGRQPGRLAAPQIKIVRSGTFAALLQRQQRRAAPATATQVKVPRLVRQPDQIEWLQSRCINTSVADR